MNCKSLVAMTFFAGCAPAMATQQIAPVQVTATPSFQLEFDCANPARPSRSDVVRLLDLRDNGNPYHFGLEVVRAVREACVAGVPAIGVHRSLVGDRLVWAPLAEIPVRVAAN